jgi:CubicO group peptidase (beta-lactamase class C family)
MVINSISTVLNEHLKKTCYYYDLPGLAVHVGIDDEDYFFTYGWRNFIDKLPLKQEHIFHMASITKLFVGTAILKLWEKNLLNIDEQVCEYLPEFRMADRRYKDITVRHLLCHTSGMPDVKNYYWENPETDSKALMRYIQSSEVTEAHLIYSPGEGKFAYSNMGYEVLGGIIASVSGFAFEDYIEKHIFSPLGMSDTDLLTFRRDMSTVCSPHEKTIENHFTVLEHFPYNRAHGPSSTLTSNLNDMAKWSKAVLNGKILLSKTMEEAWKSHSIVPNNKERICLSWFRREQNGHLLYGHEGNDDGFRASYWVCPELKNSITVCSNLTQAPVKRINREVFNILFGIL